MKKEYDIIIIGAGSGGLNVASFMNKSGFSVLLVDKSDKNIGGDCLNTGCIPSKALIHVSKLFYYTRKSKDFGLNVSGNIDSKKVMDYIKSRQEVIRKHENASWFRKKGMDVVLGEAKFYSKDSILVNNHIYTGKKIIISTGSRPRKLKIPGIERLIKGGNYFDNENIFSLKKIPKKIIVIGGGPIGIEIGQALNRLGSKVIIIQRGDKFLPKEPKEITDILLDKLKKEGIKFIFNCSPEKILSKNKLVAIDNKGKKFNLDFDAIFVGIGRELNIPKGLEKAGVILDESSKKIAVDDYLRTSNKNIFLCGDIAGGLQFTHAAELHTKIIINNLFSPIKKKLSYDNFSWVTFSDPEIATFGINENTLRNKRINYNKIVQDFKEDDRAITDDYTEGKLILFIHKNKLVGGTMIAQNAGEIIQELILLNSANLKIKSIFNKIYPYPTASRINKKAVGVYFSNKLNSIAKKILKILY